LLQFLADLEARGVSILSLTDPIDTRSASGQFIAQLFGALAQFERGQLRERQAAGIAAARARGQHLGRRAALSPRQVQAARALAGTGATQRAIAAALGCSRATINAALHGLPPYGGIEGGE
jgi:DNA invertase Pin-like site-specific DNA recombinase